MRRRGDQSRLQAITKPPHGYHVGWIGGINFNFHSQATYVHINQSAITEVSVAPHFVQQQLATEDPAWVVR
jgi:hypothetical protein